MEPFKNVYNPTSIKKYGENIKKHYAKFDIKNFEKSINKELSKLEMKDRVRLISKNLYTYLPNNYEKSISIILKTLTSEKEQLQWEGKDNPKISGFLVWPYTQFVEDYGLENIETSFHAMYELTKRFSSEFVIRAFINKYPKESFAYLNKWKKDKNHHVRRLVSEGTRPNLPWGQKLISTQENIPKYLKLILSLRSDSSEYVRRSVANHLNDISHYDSKLFITTMKSMTNESEDVDKVIRHASRTLFKKGDKDILKLHGYNPKVKIKSILKLKPKKIKEGDSLELSLKVENQTKKSQKLLIDYIIHYPKKNGDLSPKVFRLRDKDIDANGSLLIDKKVHFKKVTTRKHYPGKHLFEIQINGVVYNKSSFELR